MTKLELETESLNIIKLIRTHGSKEKIQTIINLVYELKEDVEQKLLRDALERPLTQEEVNFLKRYKVTNKRKQEKTDISKKELSELNTIFNSDLTLIINQLEKVKLIC